MGKRKYNNETERSSTNNKKERPDTQDEINSVDVTQPQNDQNMKLKPPFIGLFDVKQFRKDLSTKPGQIMVLTQFLQACLNPDSETDYMLEYLKSGGNSHEILRQVSSDSKKNLSIATPAFHLFHLIILKVQSSLPHLISITEEACRYFLNNFMSTIEIMISESSSPRHRKIVLKLFTSMVTLNPDLGIEVLNQAPLTPKHLHYITEKQIYKEKDNVRTAFVHFMTSFLVDGHLPLIKALLEKQGLLSLVIPGLLQDDPENVMMFLNILKKNIIENSFISKSLKLKMFNHQVLHNMFKVYGWKGPMELNNEVRSNSYPVIVELLSEIITTLFTNHKLGLYFTDASLGTADSNKNPVLYKALLSLKRPWENKFECDTILYIIYKCPDLHRAIISVIEQSFEPQHSPIWEKSVDFVIKLLNTLKPEEMLPRLTSLKPIQIANLVRFITLPVPLLKQVQCSLQKDQTISLYCIKLLVKMLESLKRYMYILNLEDPNIEITDLKNKLEYFIPKHLPTPAVIVSLIDDVIEGKSDNSESHEYKLTKLNDTESLVLLTELLLLYNDVHPAFFETLAGSIDMKKLLDYSATLTGDRMSLLKFKIVSLWLAIDNTTISLKNKMFKELLLIMLEVYMNENENTWFYAKDTLFKFFKNTTIFEEDEAEIHLLLYTLRNSHICRASLIGDVVEYVLQNTEKLNESIRSQMVHFETSEISQICLDKLFKNLMENESTDNSVLLDIRLPSFFVIGCIEYMQNNKDAKKNLKSFLSVYVANLLHCKISPELTMALIGNFKVDARSYVASWIEQPEPLPDNIAEKDSVIHIITKSIINNVDYTIKHIFQYLEESDNEYVCDIEINNIKYKINVSGNIDTSELLIWANYLIFCIIRLTTIDQLFDDKQKKISNYLECIIAVAKKYHLIDICRVIIKSLLNNVYFLKIYKPFSKHKSCASSTNFLIHVLAKHTKLVNYLDKSHNLLKPYKEKNYKEIEKALIKIKKKNNIDPEQIINVLETVGLSEEHDLLVLNHIFNTDIEYFFKEDKEPTFVIEILRFQIEKYSKTTGLELTSSILGNVMKLYTNLLTTKGATANMTKLENSLLQYFEFKPHQVKYVSEDNFKQFFYAPTIRKSTSQLASVLLKFNNKLCNIFKEQISRTEILGLRELTLPLGNALLNHNIFLIENKEFLLTIFNEYKSNIYKILEKPHKAGQIYFSCWRFIRKLLLECTEINDCQKLFNKIHKFEVVELNHVHLIQAVFLKMCLQEESVKKEHVVNYFLSMLNLGTTALKEGKDVEDIVKNIYQVAKILDNIKFFHAGMTDFQKITSSPIWQTFCKAVLKDSLRMRRADDKIRYGPQALFLLSTLIQLFYPKNHEDIVSLFDMVTSHSEFLNVMLSHHSTEIKSRLIEFLYTLITLNESVMKLQQIPVYLSAYHATRSPCDRLILKLLHFYETHGQPVNEYKPYIFGDSAASHYAVRKKSAATLWGHPTANQVVHLFEKDIIERTIRSFPVNQKFEYDYLLIPNINITNDGLTYNGSVITLLTEMSEDDALKPKHPKDNESAVEYMLLQKKYDNLIPEYKDLDLTSNTTVEDDEHIYDPLFLFPLLGHLLAPGSMVSCFKIMRSRLLSVPVMALSSHCPSMRAAAYHVLHRFCLLLETETRHKNDKLLLTDFIETLRHSLVNAISNPDDGVAPDQRNPRLPAVCAIYLARALMVTTAPFDPLYKPVNNFFIAKQVVDFTTVPDFLSLFHDSDVESVERRLWILDIIKDGTKTMTDIIVIFRTMCLKMIMDFYSSVLNDRKTKDRILATLSSLVCVSKAFEILIEGYGLISWLHSVVKQIEKDDKAIVKRIIELIQNMLYSLNINAFNRMISAKGYLDNGSIKFAELNINKDVEHEILVILYDLLHHVEILDTEDIVVYVNTFKLLSRKTLKLSPKKQMLSLVKKCTVNVGELEIVKILVKALGDNDALLLNSKLIFEVNNKIQSEDCLLQTVITVVRKYLD